MRVLFVAPYVPSRIRVRSYGFVRHLAEQHEVTVLALGAGKRGLAEADALRCVGVALTVIQESRYRPYLRGLACGIAAPARQWPLQVAFGASPGMRAAVAAELAARHYDVLHVESVRALEALPPHIPIPVIWDAVDCVTLLFEEGARVGATPMLRIIGHLEARRLAAYERMQLGRFRRVLVTSERDRQALLRLAGASALNAADLAAAITVLPHGVDPCAADAYGDPRRPGTLVFSGKMDFHANVAGALTFTERVLPRIWQQRPDVRLVIAGSGPPPAVQRLGRDARITVTGHVPDLRPHIAMAQVAVSPLPYAVGIQNKVLEAMALGTPVVASSSAAAGLQAVPGRDLMVADDPDAFAAAVLQLMDDPATWQHFSEHGLAYVAEHHNWATIASQLTGIYSDMRVASLDVPRMAATRAAPGFPPPPQVGGAWRWPRLGVPDRADRPAGSATPATLGPAEGARSEALS